MIRRLLIWLYAVLCLKHFGIVTDTNWYRFGDVLESGGDSPFKMVVIKTYGKKHSGSNYVVAGHRDFTEPKAVRNILLWFTPIIGLFIVAYEILWRDLMFNKDKYVAYISVYHFVMTVMLLTLMLVA